MSWLEALILGVVQGLTEFLPVSSSGHIEIGQAILGTGGEDNLTFAVIVHAATVCSTLVCYGMKCQNCSEELLVPCVGIQRRIMWQKY
jgi:undecaprenyl pyrophosphate phosphatase UppP